MKEQRLRARKMGCATSHNHVAESQVEFENHGGEEIFELALPGTRYLVGVFLNRPSRNV